MIASAAAGLNPPQFGRITAVAAAAGSAMIHPMTTAGSFAWTGLESRDGVDWWLGQLMRVVRRGSR